MLSLEMSGASSRVSMLTQT